jgi:hypothetical protein
MSRFPRNSPWGEVQHCDVLSKGVFAVNTEDSGGVMVRKNAADFLSPEARKIGLSAGNYLCFNKGNDEAVVFRELLDSKMLNSWATIQPVFVDYINKIITEHKPEYWEARQTRLSAEAKPPTLAERLEAGKVKAAQNPTDIPRKGKSATEH